VRYLMPLSKVMVRAQPMHTPTNTSLLRSGNFNLFSGIAHRP
jgi:hypothetical protein